MRPVVGYALCIVASLAVVACEADDNDDPGAGDAAAPDAQDGADLRWFTTCGDPVCQPSDPTPENPCSDQQEDAACSEAGASCELGTCGKQLVCTGSDPKQDGCPISQRAAKTQIRYVDDRERTQLLQELLAIRLATYEYKGEQRTRRLGFIIDDVGPGYVVLPSGGRVDVYGFASMAVAAIQAQEARLAELEAKLAAVERRPALLQQEVTLEIDPTVAACGQE